MLLSVPGIYEDGKVSISENISIQGRPDVIITFLENRKEPPVRKEPLAGLLSDLSEDDFRDFLGCCCNRERTGLTGEVVKKCADYNGFRGGSDSGSRPRVSVLQSSGRTFRKNGTFRGDRYAGRPVRIVPERTDLPFCHLIISGGCALP